MEDGRSPKRYRGYRPPPLWWYKLKYSAVAAILALFVIFTVFQVVHGVLTGRIDVALAKPDEVVRWSSAPWLFVWQLILWSAGAFLSVAGFYASVSAIKGLEGPSAETRI